MDGQQEGRKNRNRSHGRKRKKGKWREEEKDMREKIQWIRKEIH